MIGVGCGVLAQLLHAARDVDLHERVLGFDLVDVLVLLAVEYLQEVAQLRNAERLPLHTDTTTTVTNQPNT